MIFRAGGGVHAAWLDHRARIPGPLQRLTQRWSPYHRYVLGAEKAMFGDPALQAVICNSQMVADEVERYYGVSRDKLQVIYNGVDTEAFHPGLADKHRLATRSAAGIPSDAPVLLYVGSGFERKGVPQLLRAAARMKRDDACIVIVGADRKLSAMRKLSGQLGLSTRVLFTGPLKDVRPGTARPMASCCQRFTTRAPMLRWRRWPAACRWSPRRPAARRSGCAPVRMAGWSMPSISTGWPAGWMRWPGRPAAPRLGRRHARWPNR